MTKRILSLKLLIFLLCFPVQVFAENNIEKVDLKNAIQLSLKNSDTIQEKKLDVKKAENLQTEIRGNFNPKVNVNLGVGPINKETGDALTSQTKNSWGPILIGNIKLTYPLWAWGKKKDLLNAASYAKSIEEQNVKIEKSDLISNIKKLYFGHLLSKTLLKFANETKDDVEGILSDMKKKKSSKEDQFRLEILISDIKTKIIEIKEKFLLTRKALSFLISGKENGMNYSPQEDWLEYKKRTVRKNEYYISLAKKSLPQWDQINSGILAKKDLLKAEKKSKYPIFGILAEGKWSQTNQRNKQQSSFAFDPYNEKSLSIGLGVTMDLDWGITDSKIEKIKLDIGKLEKKNSFAQKALTIQIIKSIERIRTSEKKVKYLKRAKKFAKKWLSRVVMAISMGLLNSEKIVDAYGARALTFKNYFEAIFEHHMAWSNLSKIIGQEIDPILIK